MFRALRVGQGTHAAKMLEMASESCMLHCNNNKGEALDHTVIGWRDLMAGLGVNLTNSVANVRRKLLQMMDALAESGMRHAHREISRGQKTATAPRKSDKKRRASAKDESMH
ncbi:MAG TPA: hypothetical protein VMH84_18055 [Xanthobacteraceae bacterium]|nr:hypothetical protein [Xanthobacteraceae bacterium]